MLDLRLMTTPPPAGGYDFLNDVPVDVCYVGEHAAREMADYARNTCGATALVISDENTRAAAGDAPLRALRDAGKQCIEHVFPAHPLDATQELADSVADLGAQADFYVAIGSGSLCDLAKSAGTAQGKPVLLYATAASMNGYTSGIVALKVRGLKRTLPCKPAEGVFADPAVIAAAPQRMTAAGVADFLSKCSSSADWLAGYSIRGGFYTDRPRRIVGDIQNRLFAEAHRVGRGDADAAALALEALLLSGFGMIVAGSSAPASGGEHLISHYIDMKHALHGTGLDLHGAQVGVATIYTLQLWEQVLDLDPASIDPAALAAAHPSQDTIHDIVFSDWGEAVGNEVWPQWCEKALSREALEAEIAQIARQLPELRATLSHDLVASKTVADCIAACGGPITADALDAPAEEFARGQRYSRYLRNRFTILDLAAELGVAP
jgi:glycerol-1-phosphate dehydrogenase [NAD(P)+]